MQRWKGCLGIQPETTNTDLIVFFLFFSLPDSTKVTWTYISNFTWFHFLANSFWYSSKSWINHWQKVLKITKMMILVRKTCGVRRKNQVRISNHWISRKLVWGNNQWNLHTKAKSFCFMFTLHHCLWERHESVFPCALSYH